MPTIEKTTEYAATPEAIWAAVSDFAAWPTWLTILKEWTNEPPRELSVGTTLEGAVTIMNIPMAVSWVIQSVDPPRGLAITGTAVLGSEVSFDHRGGAHRRRLRRSQCVWGSRTRC